MRKVYSGPFPWPSRVFLAQEGTHASRTMVFLRRRRQERKAARLARLLVALDASACEQRPWRPRRASSRASVLVDPRPRARARARPAARRSARTRTDAV